MAEVQSDVIFTFLYFLYLLLYQYTYIYILLILPPVPLYLVFIYEKSCNATIPGNIEERNNTIVITCNYYSNKQQKNINK